MTPEQWLTTPHDQFRASMERLLLVEGEPHAQFASYPFRHMEDGDGKHWIVGAVGCAPLLEWPKLRDWTVEDITDLIMLQPHGNVVALAGEAAGTSRTILPSPMPDRLPVFRDGLAFFRAWAARRLRVAKWAMEQQGHPVSEGNDGCLPGALVVGDMNAIPWSALGVNRLIASRGTDRRELENCVLAAARLPSVEEGRGARD